MSTYPVDIKAKRITSTSANQEVFGGPGRFLGFSANCTAGPGRALGLFVSKEGGQAATTVKILDDAAVLAEFLIPATNTTNGPGSTTYMQFPGTGLRASTALK